MATKPTLNDLMYEYYFGLEGTPVTAAGTPTSPVATAGAGFVSVSFVAPASTGSEPILGYEVILSNGRVASGTSSPIVVPTPGGSAVTATVKAFNGALGVASAASNSVTPTVVATVPGAPTVGTLTPGQAQVSLAFTAPASNGGSAVIDYRVTLSNGQIGSGTASPIVVTGVPSNPPVSATVAARNLYGYGPESAISNTTSATAEAPGTGGPGQSEPEVPILVQIARRIGAPSSPVSQNTNGFKQFNNRQLLSNRTTVPVNQVRFLFINAVATTDGTMIPGPRMTLQAAVTPVGGSLGSNPARTPLLFGGLDTKVLEPDEQVWSDPHTFATDVPPLSGDTFSLFHSMVYETAPAYIPANNINSTDANTELSEGAVSGLTLKAFGGQIIGRISPKLLCGPSAIVATPVGIPVGHRLYIVGNSITSGSADTAGSNVIGFAQRAAQSSGLAWTIASQEGYSWTRLAQAGPRSRTLSAAHGATIALCFMNTNDIASGRTSAQIRSDMQSFKASLAPFGITKLIVSTCFPRTDAGNTAESGAGTWTRLNQLNADIRANNGIGDGFFDINMVCRDTTNTNLWRSDLGVPTADGIHPYPIIHNVLTTELTSFLAALPAP